MTSRETCFSNTDRVFGEFGVREMHSLGLGHFIHAHTHNYPHLEVVIRGSIRLTLGDGEPRVMQQGEVVEVPAETLHTAEALEDGTVVYCIFHARNAEGGPMVNNEAFI